MEKLKKLCRKLEAAGKDASVRAALEALLAAPDDLDLQIDVLGAAHQANWLPNQRRVFWQDFPINTERWVSLCVERVIKAANDYNALYALRNTNTLLAARAIQAYSPDLVLVWDVNGAEACGIGLARHQDHLFKHYFYIGWQPTKDTLKRIEYIPDIEPPLGYECSRLDEIPDECKTTGGFWAELPYGFGHWEDRRVFSHPAAHLKPYGSTDTLRRQLGYQTASILE